MNARTRRRMFAHHAARAATVALLLLLLPAWLLPPTGLAIGRSAVALRRGQLLLARTSEPMLYYSDRQLWFRTDDDMGPASSGTGFHWSSPWRPIHFRSWGSINRYGGGRGDPTIEGVWLPLWQPTLLAAATWFLTHLPLRRATRLARTGACPHCAYDLRGLPTPHCPECGHTT